MAKALGGPITYGQDVREEVLAGIAEGLTVRAISRLPGMPCYRLIIKWCATDPEFKAAYQDAKTVGYQEIVDRLRRVAKGEEGFSTGDVRRDQLVIELDKWVLAKWEPGTYGDRVAVEHSGSVEIQTPMALEQINSLLEKAMSLSSMKLVSARQPKLIEYDAPADTD